MIDSYEKLMEVDDLYDRIVEFASLNNGATEIELLATFGIMRHVAAYYLRRLQKDGYISVDQQ